MKQGYTVIIVSVLLVFVSACVSEPGIDKGKFSELNQTVHALQTVIKSDKPCAVPKTLLQKLSTETAALEDKMVSKGEKDLLAAYAHLLTTYQDGLLLCEYQAQMNRFQFVPKGRIYVFQELDPLVEKYGFSTERHVYPPTGVHWKSISGDSILVIWESAGIQTKYIENMVNYN
jgi:hypothetical protein